MCVTLSQHVVATLLLWLLLMVRDIFFILN